MQTFLPYPDFYQSAMIIDKKRCWKQTVEAIQIINTIESNFTKGWVNHPAVLQWKNNIDALTLYYSIFLEVSKTKWKINTKMISRFQNTNLSENCEFIIKENNSYCTIKSSEQSTDNQKIMLPWWFGAEQFHRAQRARLIAKDEQYYLPLFPADKGFNNSKYFWPDMNTNKFYII